MYAALEEIAPDVVFVGGATVSLYADRPAVETRPTDDIDIMVEVADYGEYGHIEEKLRNKGFANDYKEAFKGRGKDDGRTSSDFEDIVHVLNNRTTIWDEISATNGALRAYLAESFSAFLRNP